VTDALATNPLGEALDKAFDSLFPSITPPRAPDRWDLLAEDRVKRLAHVAEVLPDLVRLYAVTPEKIAAGFDEVSMYLVEKHGPLVSAIATRDQAEIGRLLLAGIDARIRQLAEDDAEDDGYRIVPERDL
jgi:hypothetical protein